MTKIKIDLEGLELFGQLCKQGHAVGTSDATRGVIRGMRKVGISVIPGYTHEQHNPRVVLVLGQPVRITGTKKRLNGGKVFDLEL